MNEKLAAIKGQLIVSCQAADGDPLRDSTIMAKFAQMSVEAGAGGIRANGPDDIAAIRAVVDVPIIGLAKQIQDDGVILITPTFEAARDLVRAGAGMVAIDCTARGRRYGAIERIAHIREQLKVPILADIATLEEAVEAVNAGVDAVLTTMRGYTAETQHVHSFDIDFLRELLRTVKVPVIAEGRINTPEQAAAALAMGAFAVIVGSAITRPRDIARSFVSAIKTETQHTQDYAIGIDLGGTNTKFAVAGRDGRLQLEGSWPTPALEGRGVLLEHLKSITRNAIERSVAAGIQISSIGIATAGWVDPNLGRVVYATGNLPGWTGTGIREELEAAVGLPVAVENDANALAVGERYFGAAQGVDHFVCVTLGTGVGGGCFINGKLNHGAHFMANALGHICIQPDGMSCTCGQRGCLEQYANAAALVRYAGPGFDSAEAVVTAARNGDAAARQALRVYAGYLAHGCATMAHLLDPELIVLSGGIAQENTMLLEDLRQLMKELVIGSGYRDPRIELSPLAWYGGVLGAVAVALDRTAAS